jgi:hypothetical protein
MGSTWGEDLFEGIGEPGQDFLRWVSWGKFLIPGFRNGEYQCLILPFDQCDVFFCIGKKGGPVLECGDVTDRFQHMDRILEETEQVGRVNIYTVFLEEKRGYLPVVKACLPQLDDLPGEFPLGTATVGTFPAFAAKKCVEKGKDLVSQGMIEVVEIEPGADGIQCGAMKSEIRDPEACDAFQFSGMPETCLL